MTHLASSALAHGTSVEASTSCFVSAGFDCVFSGIKDAGGCLGLDSLGFFSLENAVLLILKAFKIILGKNTSLENKWDSGDSRFLK